VVCTVTASDGTNSDTLASSAVTISNTPPTVTSVSVSPSSPTASSTLTCTPGSSSDPDGDSISYNYVWSINGSTAGSGVTLSSGFSGGDTVACQVEPTDGTDTGSTVSASVSIGNSAPSVTSVTVSPTTAYEATTLTCTPSGSDADGDTISWSYAWTIGGTTVSTGTTITGSTFDKGDVVRCVATPSDGTDTGSSGTSSAVTISNTAPVVTSVSVTPSSATVASTLTCSASSSDADGDSIAITYAWSVSGTTIGTGSTISSGFSKGDSVVCTATGSDGTDNDSDTDTVSIGNTAPVMGTVSITPTSPTDADTLTCTGTASDADGDSLSYSYDWTVSGTTIGTASTVASGFSGGDTVVCEITASDASDTDSASASASIASSWSGAVLADLIEGDLLITEFHADPSAVTDANGEYIEIYNLYGSEISLMGLVVSDGANSDTISSLVTIPADDYVVLCRNDDSGSNGGVTCDWEWSTLTLGNTGDVITLDDGTTTFDEVDYTSWGTPTPGASLSLAYPTCGDLDTNDLEALWCDEATATISSGDYGTPASDNSSDCLSSNTYGETGSHGNWGLTAGFSVAQQVTVSSDGYISGFQANSLSGGFNDLSLALYTDNRGPDELVAESLSTLEVTGLYALDLNSTDSCQVGIEAGTYWLAMMGDASWSSVTVYDSSNYSTHYYKAQSYPSSGWQDPYSADGTYSAPEYSVAVTVDHN
jgi:hypothetical protein